MGAEVRRNERVWVGRILGAREGRLGKAVRFRHCPDPVVTLMFGIVCSYLSQLSFLHHVNLRTAFLCELVP